MAQADETYAILKKNSHKILHYEWWGWVDMRINDELELFKTDKTGASPNVNESLWYRTNDDKVAMFIMVSLKVESYSNARFKTKTVLERLEFYKNLKSDILEKYESHIIGKITENDILLEKFIPLVADLFIF